MLQNKYELGIQTELQAKIPSGPFLQILSNKTYKPCNLMQILRAFCLNEWALKSVNREGLKVALQIIVDKLVLNQFLRQNGKKDGSE